MPLTDKGKKILAQLRKHYGKKKGTSVFYAMQNKGKITGTHKTGAASGGSLKKLLIDFIKELDTGYKQ